MTVMKFILTCSLLILFLTNLFGQDTLRLTQKPNVILKSWYPEFKEFPSLKLGEEKILFTIIPDFEKTLIRDNDIDLRSTNAEVDIKETEKTNQYLVTVLKADTTDVEFEIWLDIGDRTILLKQNSVWKNITDCYPFKDNRIMIQSIKLKIVK
jgi:hypothetical protein